MAPERPVAHPLRVLGLAVLLAVAAAPVAQASRIIDWNILNYPGTSGPARDPYYRTVLAPLAPDLMVTEEMNTAAGVNEFLTSVLNTLEPGQWSAATFIDGNDTDAALFWKSSRYQFLGQWAFYPNPAYQLRYVHVYRLKPVGYTSDQAEFRIYAVHLKASSGSSNAATRAAEAQGLRDSMNAMPPGTHAIVLGDFNFYDGYSNGSGELAVSYLVGDQANDIGRLYDPLGFDATVPWQDNTALAYVWTQSPCQTGATCASGAATGGVDDRFDLIWPTLNFGDGQGLDVIPNSTVSVGNDGQHHNLAITSPPTIPEGADYANALILSSDHLPVRVDIQWPSKMTVTGGPVAFGTAIVGGQVTSNAVSVANPAPTPSDVLDYTLTVPAGFTAPAGPQTLNAGAPAATPTLGLDTTTPGTKSGNLVITSDAPDNPTASIALSGTVLRHAVASLDSAIAQLATTLDFGVHDPGGFTDMAVRVHDQGYDALQARLAVASATIAGGDGHFSLVGGTAPTLLAGVGETYSVRFDDAGATRDSLYSATLTIASGDEALPGALAQPGLVATLEAKLTPGGATGVTPPALPTATRLYDPYPNPLHGATTVRFDLARSSAFRLEVFDLTGRRVATLASGTYPAGAYQVPWDGRDDAGAAVGSGLYFVRMSGHGMHKMIARLAVVR